MYNDMLSALMPAIVIMIIFYFLLVRPMKKSEEKHKKTIDSLKVGDKIITSSGIIGTIKTIGDDSIVLKTATSEIEISKDSISDKKN